MNSVNSTPLSSILSAHTGIMGTTFDGKKVKFSSLNDGDRAKLKYVSVYGDKSLTARELETVLEATPNAIGVDFRETTLNLMKFAIESKFPEITTILFDNYSWQAYGPYPSCYKEAKAEVRRVFPNASQDIEVKGWMHGKSYGKRLNGLK